MHTDEAVNSYITGELLAGEKYRYDPQDRHGPVLYLLAQPLARLCGASQFSELTESELRLAPVIVGSATVLLFGAGVELFGFLPCLLAALLFACGPLPVYYSRYFIHETLFVAATFGLILSGWRALKHRSVSASALAGLCAALMLASKETAVIHFFALALALLAGWILTRTKREVMAPPPFRAAVKAIAVASVTFLAATILLFTWFGRHWPALADLLRAIPHLAGRAGGQGHEKPFVYYFAILDPLFLFFIVAAAGVYSAVCDAVAGTRRAGLLLVVYALAIFLVYSLIPYKTPWLALNFWLPMALLCGLGVEGIWLQIKSSAGRWFAAAAAAGLVLVAAEETKTLAFDHPADARNPLAYAHTTDDLLGLPPRLEELCRQRHLSHPRIAVVAKNAWPLPWYLRRFSGVSYWQPGEPTGAADFFITTTDIGDTLAGQLKEFRPEYFGVRPNVLIVLWIPPAD